MQIRPLFLLVCSGTFAAGFFCARSLPLAAVPGVPAPVAAPDFRVVPQATKRKTHARRPSFTERLDEVIQFARDDMGHEEFDFLGEELSLEEVQVAIAGLPQMKPEQREPAKRLLLRRWAILDPEAAIAFSIAERAKNLFEGTNSFGTVFKAWAERDPVAAESAISRLPNESLRAKAKEELGLVLIDKDPARGLNLVREASRFRHDSKICDAIKIVAEKQPAIALSMTMQVNDARAFAAMAEGWAKTDPAGALNWAKTLRAATDREAVYGVIVDALASSNPRLAAITALEVSRTLGLSADNSFAASGAASRWRFPGTDPMTKALSHWAKTDWKAAYDWINSVQLQSNETDYLLSAMPEFLTQEPAELLERLKVGDGERKTARVSAAVLSWASRDIDAAVSWLRQQNDPEIANAVWPALAGTIAAQSPARALELVNTLGGELKENAMKSTLENWAGNHPTDAAAFVLKEPDGPSKLKHVTSVALIWSLTNRTAADKWISTLSAPMQKEIRASLADLGIVDVQSVQ